MKPRLRLFAKIAVSAACLAAVFTRIDTADLSLRLRGIAWLPFLVATLINVALQYVHSFKMRVLFPPPRPRFRSLVELNFMTVFFAAFLPGGVGGDVARWAILTRESGSRDRALAAILLDRITGLWTQIIMALAAWIWMGRHTLTPWAAVPLSLGILGASLGAGMWGYRGIIRTAQTAGAWFARRTGKPEPVPEGVAEALKALMASRSRFPKVAALSLCFQGFVVVDFLLLNRAIGAHLDWTIAVMFLFFYTLILMAPISLGNLGFSEGTLGALYHLAGSSGGTGVAISLLLRAMAAPAAAAGWALFLARKPGPGSSGSVSTEKIRY